MRLTCLVVVRLLLWMGNGLRRRWVVGRLGLRGRLGRRWGWLRGLGGLRVVLCCCWILWWWGRCRLRLLIRLIRLLMVCRFCRFGLWLGRRLVGLRGGRLILLLLLLWLWCVVGLSFRVRLRCDGVVSFVALSCGGDCTSYVVSSHCFETDGSCVAVASVAASHYPGALGSGGGPAGADAPPATLGHSTGVTSRCEVSDSGWTVSGWPRSCWPWCSVLVRLATVSVARVAGHVASSFYDPCESGKVSTVVMSPVVNTY